MITVGQRIVTTWPNNRTKQQNQTTEHSIMVKKSNLIQLAFEVLAFEVNTQHN